MKSPEDIKKGLECCFPSEDPDCFECPYRATENCFTVRINDILAYIKQLEREMDAAVEQLKAADMEDCLGCDHCKHSALCETPVWPCNDCDNEECPCHTCFDGSNWNWIGVQEVE